MSCDNCNLGDFSVNGSVQTGTPFPMSMTTVGVYFSGPGTGGKPTWKTQGADGESVFGLMGWSAIGWSGRCVEEDGGDCKQIYPCGGVVQLKFMLMVPKGSASDVTLTSPAGNPATQLSIEQLPGSATNDVYRVDFSVSLEADCGAESEIELDKDWTVTINGVNATHHTASGGISFKIACERCED